MPFIRLDERNGIFNFGIHIQECFRGKGYGFLAFELALKYGFEERRMNKYQSSVMEGNFASQNLVCKFGCKKEGELRATSFHKGKYWNTYYFGLLATEYFHR